MAPDPRKVQRRWSEAEDKVLNDEAQKQYKDNAMDWSRIASRLPGRTNKDCRKRWVNHACGSLKKGQWDDSEDKRLLESVETHGQRWSIVAKEVGFRSPDQCAKRWQYSLDPRLEHKKWAPEEDELLLSLVKKHGREWKMIQEDNYPGRSRNELKNRHTILTRAQNVVTPNKASGTDATSSVSEGLSPGTRELGVTEQMDLIYEENDMQWTCEDTVEDWQQFLGTPSNTSQPCEASSIPAQSSTPPDPQTLNTTVDPVKRPDMVYPKGGDVDMMLPYDFMRHYQQTQAPNQPAFLGDDMFTTGLPELGGSAGDPSTEYSGVHGQLPDDMFATGLAELGGSAGDLIVEGSGVRGQITEMDAVCQAISNGEGSSGEDRVYAKVVLQIDSCDQDTLDQLLDITRSPLRKTKMEIHA